MGAIVNLTLGGIAGAIFFSLGLITIVTFKLDLFTGKAGLLVPREIEGIRLAQIWLENFVGCAICAYLIKCTDIGDKIMPQAKAIVATRLN